MGLKRTLHLYAPYQAGDDLSEIQALRARCYVADGAIAPCDRHVVDGDEAAWHIACKKDGKVVGCVSAILRENSWTGEPCLNVHSWALDDSQRKTRAGIDLALACYALAEINGLRSGSAYATSRNGSSAILGKLGGRNEGTVMDDRYRCEMSSIWFSVGLLPEKHRKTMKDIKQQLISSQYGWV